MLILACISTTLTAIGEQYGDKDHFVALSERHSADKVVLSHLQMSHYTSDRNHRTLDDEQKSKYQAKLWSSNLSL